MTAPAFDPLAEFYGMWNTDLADRYLPLPDLPNARFECVDGRLVMTPVESRTNDWGETTLTRLLHSEGSAAGFFIQGPVNLTFNPQLWIHPDVVVLNALPRDDHEDMWVPAEHCTMVVEFVSRSSVYRDRVDKPAICAAGGIPYFMRVELVREPRHASVELLKLVNRRYETLAAAVDGERIEVSDPFPIGFDPADLLYPRA